MSESKIPEISKIITGYMRCLDWPYSPTEHLAFIHELIDLKITSFDHADIYGDYEVESFFGKILSLDKSIRHDIQLITKCGIKLLSNKYPNRKIKHYDYCAKHIISSVNNSLKNFNTDYIDVLLLHRPAPFYQAEEINKAFHELLNQGKVLSFGVSNFDSNQFDLLNSQLDLDLAFNQIECSPLVHEHFNNKNLEFCRNNNILPMVWSPFAGGRIFNPHTQQEIRVHSCLKKIAKEINCESIDMLALAWLLKHPSNMHPILGTGKIERYKKALAAVKLDLNLEQWYMIYTALEGKEVA